MASVDRIAFSSDSRGKLQQIVVFGGRIVVFGKFLFDRGEISRGEIRTADDVVIIVVGETKE